MAAPPILADITVNGRAIKAIAQPTKQSWLYVFDRTNGQPVWPIVERPVPKGDVPGEWYSPTQPFLTKPPAVRSSGRVDRRSDRLHAGAAGGGREVRCEIQDRSAVHAAGGQQGRRSARHVDAAVGRRRRQLGGRRPTIPKRTRCTCIRRPRPPRSVSCRLPQATTSAGSRETRRRRAAAAAQRGAGAPAVRLRARRSSGRSASGGGRRGGADGGEGGGGGGSQRSRTAADQAAVRAHHRDRLEQGRHRLAGRARRNAGQRPQSPRSQGRDDSADRPDRRHRHARHEDARHRRRTAGHHDAGSSARRDAARVRQGDTARKSAPCSCRRRRPDRR